MRIAGRWRRKNPEPKPYQLAMEVVADRYVVGLGVLIRADRGSRNRSAASCFQVLCAGSRPFRLRSADDARGILCTRAIIPPRARYVIDGDDVAIVTAFVDADGILGRRARYELDATTRRGASAWVEVGERLAPPELWSHVAADDCHTAVRRLANALDRKQRGLAYAGARVRHVTALVESSLPDRVSLAALAGAVDMTLEHFTRLLLEEVGLAARPFVRWLRLRRYAELVSSGVRIDEAVRAAGYRRRSELTQELRLLVGFTERDVEACENWKSLTDRPQHRRDDTGSFPLGNITPGIATSRLSAVGARAPDRR